MVGKSISTIKRAMRELCKYGAVERTPRFRKDGGQTSNLYKIVPCNFEKMSNSEDVNKADRDQIEVCGAIKEDISFSVPEVNETPCAYTPSMEKKEKDNREHKDDKNNSFEESEANTIDDLGDVHIFSKTTENTANRFKLSKYINGTKHRMSYWFKSINQKIQCPNLSIFKKNEPGGGHGRPPRNLSI
ncbi:hypothetical protein L323_11690 [Ruminiclostridium papyrosolvens C7]|uniref:Uncharacterized protein n=1 Tax=Ruminiclostridium papyrosolvens C7 TaxID=1330534 RepID=U4R0G0_9FIRM|nr:hypothetical protein L323_11690 [Ruminiclostridium papyrosolvens C7]